MKGWAKIIAVNIVVLGFLISLVNVLSITATRIEAAWDEKADSRGTLPNFAHDDWAPEHFREFLALNTEYRSYYGWRRRAFAGKTINIDQEGIRQTVQGSGAPAAKSIAFFGGSTMWGTGADDKHTIPSLFAKRSPDHLAYNFGESGHTAHQNLNVLIEQIATGLLPDVVVFYNGVNEVSQCRRELRPYAHAREVEIKSILDTGGLNFHDPGSYLSLLFPIERFVTRLSASLSHRFGSRPPAFDCDQEPAKAEAIARLLLWDWTIAKRTVEGYGGRFLAVLQPVAYFSRTKTDQIKIEADRAVQYQAVYPAILHLLDNEFAFLKENFLDLRTALDRDEYIYIDFCHISGNGNDIIASKIDQHLEVNL